MSQITNKESLPLTRSFFIRGYVIGLLIAAGISAADELLDLNLLFTGWQLDLAVGAVVFGAVVTAILLGWTIGSREIAGGYLRRTFYANSGTSLAMGIFVGGLFAVIFAFEDRYDRPDWKYLFISGMYMFIRVSVSSFLCLSIFSSLAFLLARGFRRFL